jgi:hypothetical protein
MKKKGRRVSMAEPIKDICRILQNQLNLTDKQIWIYNQKRDIPNDTGVYFVVNFQGQRIIGNTRREVATLDGLKEEQSVHNLAVFSVDVFSRSSRAREMRDLAIMALNSTYSQQVQEEKGFQIARNSFQVTNTSEVEGVAELNRYSISFNVTYMSETTKSISYYDTFSKEVITEE